MADAPHQLALLEIPPCATGPARLPATRRVRALPTATLELPGLRPPVVSDLPATESAAADLPAPAASAPPTPVVRPQPPEITHDPPPAAASGPEDDAFFAWPRRPSAARRAALLDALEERLSATRRADAVEVREDRRVLVTARLADGGVRVRFGGSAERTRFVALLRELTREHGLVEPE